MNRQNKIKSKLFYGFADIYGGGSFLVISILFLVFLTDVVKMNPALAGTIPLVGKIWDAVTDPIMGNITDRTKSRFGSKRLYLMMGSFLAGITFIMLWLSFDTSEVGLYIYYLFAYLAFSTAFTIVMVPYNALLPDMISDYTLRGSYTMYRMIFSAVAAIIAGLIPNMIVTGFGDSPQTGYLVMGIVFGLLFFISILLTFIGTWEVDKTIEPMGIKDSFKQSFTVFKNRSFRLYLGIFLSGQGSADFITGCVIYFLVVVLRNRDAYMPVMAAVLISQLLAMFIYQLIIKKHSKRAPVLIGFPIRIVATIVFLFFAHEGAPIFPIVVLSFIAGLGTAASSVTSYAILTDLADIDYLITKIRRPGIYSGMGTFSRKIANGLAIWVIGILLSLFNYDANLAVQSALTIDGVKFMFIGIPIILMLLTLYFTVKFPVNRKTYNIVTKDIERRMDKSTELATDEEKEMIEKITGYKYDDLWDKKNAALE
jgi:oligogalacturonide transporter